jgi:hypothetical protein
VFRGPIAGKFGTNMSPLVRICLPGWPERFKRTIFSEDVCKTYDDTIFPRIDLVWFSDRETAH